MRVRKWGALLVAAAVAAIVLAPSVGARGVKTAAIPRVAVYASVPDPVFGNDVLTKLRASHRFVSVDSLANDCGVTPAPSLATLKRYTAVFVYSDCGFNDNSAIGDVLADYVDAGGHLVVATFAFWTPDEDLGMGGRLSTGGYLPLTQGGQTSGAEMTLVADQPFSPLLAGVGSFDGGTSSYHNDPVSVAPGGHLIAHWSGDGDPLVAVKGSASGGHVVGLNFYPPSSDARDDFWVASTDGVRLMTNALLWGTLTRL